MSGVETGMDQNRSDAPFGVFDSGLGGLTVVRAIAEALPAERLVYLGDTARVPYGTRSANTVIRYARGCGRLLAKHGIKMLVVACNTVSAVALDVLRLSLPHRGLPPGPADVVIRPEAIRIVPEGAGAGLPAKVSRATYMGSHTEYHFSTPVGELFALGPDRLSHRAPGEEVMLALDPEGVVLVRP